MARVDDVRELAEKVMGWQTMKKWHDSFEIKHPTRSRCYWWEGLRNEYCWDPYTDAIAALEVVEAMAGRGYWMRAECTDNGWYVRFGGRRFHKSNSACEAICTAALAAIREAR